MDFLINTDDDNAITYLRRHRAVCLDTAQNLWGITRPDSIEELASDIAESAPAAKYWIAAISDFKTLN